MGIESEPAAAPPPIPVTAPQPPAISFHNGTAVRIGLATAPLGFICLAIAGQLALPREMSFVWLAGAGFLAVFLYRRRTGQKLSMLNGARLGWISGIFGFAIATVILTMFVAALSEPTFVTLLREQMKAPQATDLNKVIEVLRTPLGITNALGQCFLLFTVLPAFGGAIGAKLLNRD